jgi:O-acetyl-ADP-ribose deacetylase
MWGHHRRMPLELVLGDITEQHVDAIVNAANSSLMGGGGVDGAIHRRGGPDILAECRSLRAGQYRDGLPVGQAVATTAGQLPARWVIHTVGPVYSKRADRSEALRSCYGASLRVAADVGAGSVAFPLISSGIYGWPVEDALRQALTVLRDTDQEVRLVLWQESTLRAAERLMQG